MDIGGSGASPSHFLVHTALLVSLPLSHKRCVGLFVPPWWRCMDQQTARGILTRSDPAMNPQQLKSILKYERAFKPHTHRQISQQMWGKIGTCFQYLHIYPWWNRICYSDAERSFFWDVEPRQFPHMEGIQLISALRMLLGREAYKSLKHFT